MKLFSLVFLFLLVVEEYNCAPFINLEDYFDNYYDKYYDNDYDYYQHNHHNYFRSYPYYEYPRHYAPLRYNHCLRCVISTLNRMTTFSIYPKTNL